VKKTKIDYDAIDFNDIDDYAPDVDICPFCGSESDARVGYNKKKDLLKRACSNCGVVYVEDAKCEITILEGEQRDWQTYLSQHLTFPFAAKVDEVSDEEFFGRGDPGSIRYEDEVTVLNTNFEDDLYGVIAEIRKGKKKYSYPICNLAVLDKKSPNYKIVADYRVWFDNCQ